MKGFLRGFLYWAGLILGGGIIAGVGSVYINDPGFHFARGQASLEEADYDMAFYHFHQAIENDNPDGNVALAGMYLEGRGVEGDLLTARRLLEEAAAMDHSGAKAALAKLENTLSANLIGTWDCEVQNPNGRVSWDVWNLKPDGSLAMKVSGLNYPMYGTYRRSGETVSIVITRIPDMRLRGFSEDTRQPLDVTILSENDQSFTADTITRQGTKRQVQCSRGDG